MANRLAQETQAGFDAPLRSRQPILQRRLSCLTGQRWHDNLDEPKRKLLGQCTTPMGSFFGTLKTERLYHFCFTTREQARQVVFEYIEVFYNRIRRHAKIGNQIPIDFAQQFYVSRQQPAA
jgi:transposase InsO family protein